MAGQMVIALNLMRKIQDRAEREKQRVHYAVTGDVSLLELQKEDLYFRTGRQARAKAKIQTDGKRIFLCAKDGISKRRRGIQYFVPRTHRRKKNKFFEIFAAADTIYEIGVRWNLCDLQGNEIERG